MSGKETAMQGSVIGFDPDTNTGAIGGADGRRYDFVTNDLLASGKPGPGDIVDFTPDDRRATGISVVQPAYMPPSLGAFYFSPRGRIARSHYWLRFVLPLLGLEIALRVAGLAHGETRAEPGVLLTLLNLVYLAALWPGTALLVKRMHDRGKSGWLVPILYFPLFIALALAIVTLALIAAHRIHEGNQLAILAAIVFGVAGIVGIWFFVEFGCLRGTVGTNRYGPDPTPPG
jgi:uncharacterized membrane protein YhaH (DUF805 family)